MTAHEFVRDPSCPDCAQCSLGMDAHLGEALELMAARNSLRVAEADADLERWRDLNEEHAAQLRLFDRRREAERQARIEQRRRSEPDSVA